MPDMVGSEQHEPTSLQAIANKAKADKQHRFQNLYRCLDEELLLHCWGDLNKDAASGVDGMSAQAYAEDLHSHIGALVRKLRSKSYHAKLVRRKYIPKDGSDKLRPLGILVIDDKLVQAASTKLLSAIYEQDFMESSYGYRQGRGALDAVSDLTGDLQMGGYGHVVEVDVKGFFDNLDHAKLLEMLSLRIDDRAFLGLIRKWLKAGILEPQGNILYPEAGTPQGGLVSPVLANVYLHHVLDVWFEHVVKVHCQGDALLCRYADDWVCAFRHGTDAAAFYRVLPKRLQKFNLEAAPEKTRLLRFSRYHPSLTRRFTFLGFEFFWKEDRQGKPRVTRRTARKKLQGACRRIKEWIKLNRHLPVRKFFDGLNARLRGHYNYYGVRGNSRALSRFYEWAKDCAFKWLNRRGGKRRSYTWAEFDRVLDHVHIARPLISKTRHGRVMADS